MAATTLSGFLQCSFLSMDPPMQAHFEALCKTRLPKKRKRELGSIVDTIPSAGGSLNHVVTCYDVCTTHHYLNKLFSFCRPGAAPRRRSRPKCLYSFQSVRCAHLDAPAVDGPERSPEWHTTHWGKCDRHHYSAGSKRWNHNMRLSPDDCEENTVKLQANTPRQLAAA